MWDRYIIAATIEDVYVFLERYPGQSRIIAGGTDLVLEIEQGLRPEISTLIDISRLPGLDRIDEDSDGIIHIGACVTHNQVLRSTLLRNQARCLVMACSEVGSPQIRNRGTVVGNIITASPANDTIPPLVVLGAEVVLASKNGEHVIPVSEFITGVRKNVLGQGEIVKEITLPPQPTGTVSTFHKLGLRKAQAISVVNCAFVVRMEGEIIKQCKISAGAVSPRPNRLSSIEQKLIGRNLADAYSLIENEPIPEVTPITDIRGSNAYRAEMTRLLVKRGLQDLQSNSDQQPDILPVTLEGVELHTFSLTSSEEFEDQALISTEINGKPYLFRSSVDKTLLDLVREDAHLTGSKEGCGEGECGACTMFLDGKAVMACLVPAARAHNASVVTVEGISQPDQLHPVQQAFVKEGAVQCGYCTPGFVMSAVKLLEEKPKPTTYEIKTAISGNLCRCTGYYKIVSAIEKAARESGD